MELIKKVQKETTKHLDKLEDNKDKSHVNYEVSQQTVNIPAGYELVGLLLKMQDGTKVLFDAQCQILSPKIETLFQIQLNSILAV